MKMRKRALTGCVALGILIGGCSSQQFDPSKHRDVKVLGYTYYADLKPARNYREREMPYEPLRYRGDGKNSAAAIGVGVGVAVAAPVAVVAAGAIVAVVGVNAIGRGITESNRTRTLNLQPPVDSLQMRVRSAVQAGLTRQRYAVIPLPGVKHDSIKADQPLPIGNTLPSLNDEQITSMAASRRVHAVLSVDVVNYGIYKLEEAFEDDRFQPYVIVSVRMYRADNQQTIHSSFYMGTSPGPLPVTRDFDAAVADKAVLADYYNRAADNAVEMIVTDLQPAW